MRKKVMILSLIIILIVGSFSYALIFKTKPENKNKINVDKNELFAWTINSEGLREITVSLVADSKDNAYQNSVNLQNAIDEISNSGGGIVKIPSGTFYFSATGYRTVIENEERVIHSYHAIKCKDNVLVRGAGESSTILKPLKDSRSPNKPLDMFYFNDFAENIKNGNYLVNADFEYFTIDGSDSLTDIEKYNTAGKGFMINLFKDCDWNHVTVKNTAATGFGMDCPINSTIKNCTAINCGRLATDESYGASGFGIGTGFSNDEYILIDNCKSYNNRKYGFFFEHQGRFNSSDNKEFNYSKYPATTSKGFTVSNSEAAGNYINFGGEVAFDVTYINCKSKYNYDSNAGFSNIAAYLFTSNSYNINLINCSSEGSVEKIVTSSEWKKTVTQYGIDSGVLGKYEEANIDNIITKMEALNMIWKFYGRPQVTMSDSELSKYTDGDPSKWFRDTLKFGLEKGLIQGTSDTTIGVNDGVTKAQLATMLYRMEGASNAGTCTEASGVRNFYKSAVCWAIKDSKIIHGKGETNPINYDLGTGNSDSSNTLTKAEVLSMLYEFSSKRTMLEDYNMMGGTNSSSPTKTGYNFDGWISKNGDGPISGYNMKIATYSPKTYVVNYSANGGSGTTPSRTFIYDQSRAISVNNYSRTGYTFSNWNTNNSNTGVSYSQNQFVKNITSNSSITLYAIWSPNTYTLTYDNNGGSGCTSTTGKYDSYWNPSCVPTKSGYNFTGWFTSATGGSQITSSTKNTGNLTAYAHWATKTATVKFDPTGGSVSPTSRVVSVESTYETLPTPTKTGYTFIGWYTTSTSGTKIETTTSVISSSDHTLYAHWTANEYTISYETNGGTVSSTSKTVKYDSTYGTLPTPTKTGYTFNGWYNASSGGTQITSSSKVDITSNQTLYARWTARESTVTFVASGGTDPTPSTKTVKYDSTYGDLPTSTKTGYTFKGWFTTSTSTEQIVSSTKVTKYSNHSLYAQWEANIYKVTFDSQGGSAIDAKSVTYNTTYGTLTTPTKTGYTFKGWYTSKDYSTQVTSSTKVLITSAQTLYAKWEASTYSVTFNVNGGSSATSIKVTYDSTYGELPTSTKTGYDFAGWYTEATVGSQVTTNTQVKTAANHTLYAHWTPKKYKLIYDANGGNPVASKDIYYQEPYGELAVPVRGGYQFIGWYTTATSTTLVTSDNKHTKTSDVTVYAHWRSRTYTVTFDSQGGTEPASQEVKYEQIYGSLPGSVRNGYTFEGWYTDPKAGERISASTAVTATDDYTLYAHWTPNTYTVTFDGNGGTPSSNSVNVTYDSTYGDLPPATRSRYAFEGWYTEANGGTKVETSTTVSTAQNHTLYAHWESKELVVTFDSQGGRTSSQTQTFYQDETYSGILEPVKTGYTFTGWVTSLANGTKVDSNTTVSTRGTQTLYATWTANTYTVSFDSNGGSEVNSITVTYDSTYGTLPTPTKKGSTFNGWFTEKVGGTKIENTTKVTITSTQTLFAHWKTEETNEEEKTIVRTEISNPTTVASYESEEGVEVLNENGEKKSQTSNVATGDIIKKSNGEEYRVIIVGDINGDGKVSTADYVKLWNHLDRNNKNKLTKDYHLLASDINQDGKVSTADYVKLWNLLKR